MDVFLYRIKTAFRLVCIGGIGVLLWIVGVAFSTIILLVVIPVFAIIFWLVVFAIDVFGGKTTMELDMYLSRYLRKVAERMDEDISKD